MPPGRTIPVPSAGGSAAGAGGGAGAGRGRGGTSGGTGRRRGSTRSGEQAPWKSSLDLVWSYSRSQAYFGDNISTSPSFVERHWASRRAAAEGDTSVDESGYDDSYYDDEDYDEGDATDEYHDSFDETEEDEGLAAGEWSGETLPANAVGNTSQQQRRRLSTQRARNAAMRARDRRLRSLEDDDADDAEGATDASRTGYLSAGIDEEAERGRTRSRSPGTLTSSRSRESRESFGSTSREGNVSARLPRSALPSLAVRSGRSGQRSPSQGQSGELRLQNGLPTLESPGRSQPRESTPLLSKRASSSSSSGRGRSGGRRPSYQSIRARDGTAVQQRRKSSFYAIQGTSTFLQSWFNTLNALIGVGILALPLAFSYAGWIGGPVLFLLAGFVTNYTGKVLAEIMSKQPTLRTYADIGSYAFGPRARVWISLLFCLELWAVCVALVILFADSISSILPSVPIPLSAWKAIGLGIILPTIFLPLKLLSPVSVIGIISTFTLFAVVLSDGLVKKEAPGSLWQPGPTSLVPEWSRLPLSFGLIMSGFSSHPVIPSLVKDMAEPHRFPRMLNIAYVAATFIYLSIGAVGYAMFGDRVSDEITRDLARTPGFPEALNKVALILIVINPISKFALAARPINTTLEVVFGIEASQIKMMQRMARRKSSLFPGKQPSSRNSVANGLTPPRPAHGAEGDSNSSGASAELGVEGEANPLAGSMISLRAAERASGWSPTLQKVAQAAIRIVVAALITLTAIVLPGFEKVMAFLGAFLAFATCVFGPLLANLKLHHKDLSRRRIIIDIVILSVSLCAAVTGTLWAFLPEK